MVDRARGRDMPIARLSQALVPLVTALNPLGSIGQAIVEIIAYREEVKRLQVERERIKAQSNAIDSYYRAKMKDLEFRREAILIGIKHAEIAIYERRVTRDAIIRSLDDASKAMNKLISGKNFPPAHVLAVYRDTIAHLTKQLVELDALNVRQVALMSEELRLIVKDTRDKLENVLEVNQLPLLKR